ncbi:spore wall synthesis complex protein [Actinomadura chokoriensis]
MTFASRIGDPVAELSLGGAVPLSEHEQRMLEQIESALYAEDPKFAHAVRSTNPQVHYKRRIIKAALGFVVGVCALMAGLVINEGTVTIAISVTGFLLMVACCVWALTSWKRMTGIGNEPARSGGRSSRPAKAGFMERMEERWRRRTEGD